MKHLHWRGPQPHYIRVCFLFSAVTSHNKLFSSCSHQLGPSTIQNCLLRYGPSQEESRRGIQLAFVNLCVHVRACVCILPGTMNGCIVSWWAVMHAVCVFGGQVCIVSILWRAAWVCHQCAPWVSMCTFVTVKSRWSNKTLDTQGF